MSDAATGNQKLRERVTKTKAALVFVDLQNDFASPKGKMAEFGFEIGAVRDSIEPARRLLEAGRAAGWLIIHTAVLNQANSNSASWAAFWGPPTVTIPGTWGAAHVDPLAPRPGEPVIEKYAYGAFMGTNLDTMLRSRGVETLVFAGTDLNVCVGDTLHHAFALGYHVVGVADCLSCLSKHDRSHADQMKGAGLYLIRNHYGLVADTSEIIEIIKKG